MTATPLAEPCLMPLGDLIATHRAYEARVAAALLGTGPDLSPAERAHAYEVGRCVAAFRDAIRHTLTRHTD